jgi:hypothetical protein
LIISARGQRRGHVVRSNADPVHRVPQGQRLLPERARIELGPVGEPLVAAPHAVDQHIEAALLVRDPIDHCGDLIIAAGIHRRGDPGTAQRSDLLCRVMDRAGQS